MKQRDDSIDALLAEFDKSLSMSRRVFQNHGPETDTGGPHYAARAQTLAVMSLTTFVTLLISQTQLQETRSPEATTGLPFSRRFAVLAAKTLASLPWLTSVLYLQAKARDERECAICINAFG
jgi:hypothetical protein